MNHAWSYHVIGIVGFSTTEDAQCQYILRLSSLDEHLLNIPMKKRSNSICRKGYGYCMKEVNVDGMGPKCTYD